MLRALFRLDAGPSLGLGHATRCLALADELRARGWSCRFALNPGAAALIRRIAPLAWEAEESDEFDDPSRLAPLARDGCDLLVVDHYGLGAAFEAGCRAFARKILAIDDLADRPHDADLLVDSTLGRAASDYAALAPSARVLVGPAYAPLRPRFALTRVRALQRRRQTDAVASVLVALGGAAPAAAVRRLVDAACNAAPAAFIDVATGAGEGHAFAAPRVRAHAGGADPAELMASADVAVGAAGVSAWERCSLGLPSVLVELASNQALVARGLEAAGAARSAGPLEDAQDADLVRLLRELVEDETRRKAMAERAALVCDGLGARRIAGAVEALCDPACKGVSLRPARMDDGELMLRWQAAPGVRAFATNPNVPTRDEHFAWLERRLSDPLAGPFEIIEADGAPVGVVRFDLAPGEEAAYRVSILVAPEAQGRGVGCRALLAGGALLADVTIHATVLSGNDASHKMFQACHYERVGAEEYRRAPLPGA